jgi:hypothetical protein
VFPHEYRRALAESDTIKKAEEEQKAAIKAAGQYCLGFCQGYVMLCQGLLTSGFRAS